MAYQNFIVPKLYLACLLVAMLTQSSSYVEGNTLQEYNNSGPPEGTVKTIKGDNGELVDCVDIHKQPAFNNPLLKNHKIQDHTSYPNKMTQRTSTLKLMQPWHKNGMCSEGTIPIIRRRRLQGTPMKGPHFEYATIHAYAPKGTRFKGGYGNLSIWNPFVANAKDQSSSSLLVSIDSGSTFLMAGWIVSWLIKY